MTAKLVDTETGEVVEISGVHPIAAMFPMLDDEALEALAEDIEQNGLLDPIVLLPDATLVDGRNRWAAAEMRGLVVECVITPIDDVATYILSKNIARRFLSKGQQAMIVSAAVQFLDSRSVRNVASSHGISKSRVSQANVILKHASDLVDAVIAGTTALDKAYDTAQERKRQADSVVARLGRLREAAPDLAEKVDDESIPLAEAEAALREREKQTRLTIEGGREAAAAFKLNVLGSVAAVVSANSLGADIDTAPLIQILQESINALTGGAK